MGPSFLDKKNVSIEKQLRALSPLIDQLKGCRSFVDKAELLNAHPSVKEFLKHPSPVRTFLSGLSIECEVAIKSIVAIGQAERVFCFSQSLENVSERLRELLDKLVEVEKFYQEMGGIVGYQWKTLQLLSQEGDSLPEELSFTYHPADGVDISQESPEVHEAIASGIKNLPYIAEIYPVGGAADRLRLRDETTGIPLPASKLHFCGKTLLEGMVADLQAREYLHYKLFGTQLFTPISMMTSYEKNNHAQILSICKEKGWFGRPESSFRFFSQISVPVMNREGEWCLQGDMQLLLKPGGHGVIWKLARDQGVFEWLFSQGRKKAIVRQINNPIAGTDHGLLALSGIGCQLDKTFGFASCPRQVKAMEGINVLIEKKEEEGYSYTLTNIEYCDFKKCRIIDEPSEKGGLYSKFPSNTNILFVDLKAVLDAVAQCPIPGMLVNVKKTAYRSESGQMKEEEIARLESTMQNIADFFGEKFTQPLLAEERGRLRTFLTYNKRQKTISTAKRAFVLGSSLMETPEGCFLDQLKNVRELLVEKCGMQLPEVNDAATFFIKGPSFVCLYHPALGPLYTLIAQKIRKGSFSYGSELQLEIVDLEIEGLKLEGSLQIRADHILGEKDEEGILRYSEKTGKCTLKNVTVRNRGIDRDAPNIFWKNEIFRKESCSIVIHGNGEFYAEDVHFEGNFLIEVENGERVVAEQRGGVLHFSRERIAAPTWRWKYFFGTDQEILLKKEFL